MKLRNSPFVTRASCGAIELLSVYDICREKSRENRSNPSGYEANPGGVGVGRGEPLAAMRLKPGGVGVGSGEPLAAIRLKPGGVGVGSGEPLAATRLMPGGVGVGRGDPLRKAA